MKQNGYVLVSREEDKLVPMTGAMTLALARFEMEDIQDRTDKEIELVSVDELIRHERERKTKAIKELNKMFDRHSV